MIFLIAGIFFGILFFAGIGHFGILAMLLPGLWSVALIAAGVQKLRGNDPDRALEAIQRVQNPAKRGNPRSAETHNPSQPKKP